MENQWNDIKNTYRRILQNAFDTETERNAARIVLLKMCATTVDLALSGDATLRKGLVALLGDDGSGVLDVWTNGAQRNIFNTANVTSDMPRNADVPPNVSSEPSSFASNDTNASNLSDMSNVPNVPQLNVPNLGGLFTFTENFFNRNDVGGVQNSFLTSDEMRNLFPLWNYFTRTDTVQPSTEHEQNNGDGSSVERQNGNNGVA